ncbi:MAG: hypothetical protein GC168_01135 [Candidatus Hydrogenedens sp.]|nr:hypothetical protein [Candidatus Hydrogenedens sp.]
MIRWMALALAALLGANVATADVWRVTYKLEGSQLEIEDTPQGLGDAVVEVGPGVLVLEFSDNNGTLVNGPAKLVQYTMVQQFTTGIETSRVVTDILSEAAFDAQTPSVSGTLTGSTLTLSGTVPYHAEGVNTCTGALCFLAGFQNGVPAAINRTDPVTFAPIVFSGSPVTGDGFTMDRAQLPGNDNASTYLVLQGTEVRRVRVASGDADPCGNYPPAGAHTADTDCDLSFGLNEVLRIIQLYNAGRFHCGAGPEDAYSTGQGNVIDCARHNADFQTPAFSISLSELLRMLQLYNLGGAVPCDTSEDGFCPPSK